MFVMLTHSSRSVILDPRGRIDSVVYVVAEDILGGGAHGVGELEEGGGGCLAGACCSGKNIRGVWNASYLI